MYRLSVHYVVFVFASYTDYTQQFITVLNFKDGWTRHGVNVKHTVAVYIPLDVYIHNSTATGKGIYNNSTVATTEAMLFSI